MLFFYLIFIIIFLIGIKEIRKDNPNYLDKNTTTIINGMMVITVFFSHFLSYITVSNVYDEYMVTIVHKIGQLMVTSFLFYSGYGIYESIKNKKDYMDSFFKKRFIPTFINFAIAVILFIIVNLILGNNYSISKILLSFTGWESIGNSNWYMLAIFVFYLLIILLFNKKIKLDNIYRIILLSILTVIYMYVVTRFKDNYYVDTILCFPIGMFYSYYKDKIDNLLKKKYWLCIVVVSVLVIGSYYLRNYIDNVYVYNLFAMFFIIWIVIMTRRIKLNSKIITFFGVHTFWIYILQRIPMMILQNKLDNYIYFIVCFGITILLSYLMKKITDKLWKK